MKDFLETYNICICMAGLQYFIGQVSNKFSLEARIVQKHVRPKNLAPTKVWFVGGYT